MRADSEAAEIRILEKSRGGLLPGHCSCPGSDAVLIIYEPPAACPIDQGPVRSLAGLLLRRTVMSLRTRLQRLERNTVDAGCPVCRDRRGLIV